MNKKVALFANGWNGENLDFFIKGINDYFTNNDIDLFVFSSYMLPGEHPALSKAWDSIFDLPDYSFFDAAIIFGSGMYSENVDELINKCKAAGIPVVLQGVDAEEISSVTIDNYVGMKSLCDHILDKHGVSDIVYIAGDRNNDDSNLRMRVLKESMEARGRELKEENIFYAEWSAGLIYSFLNETYTIGKKKLPDAFVCANDQMALSVLSFLEHMDVKLPEDVIVTGFDNLSPGRVYSPSLATVDQRYQEQGTMCATLVEEAFNHKKTVRKIMISTSLSPGESCGCYNCKGETELRKEIGRNHWSSQFYDETLHGREKHLDNCIVSNEKVEDIHRTINEDFLATVGLETEDFHIYINPQYKELRYMNLPEDEFVGFYYNSVMEVIAARTGGVVCEESEINPKTLFLRYDGTGKGKTYVFTPLEIGNSVFGYMVMGYANIMGFFNNSFEKRKYLEFVSSINTTFTQYQRNIVDYNRAIRIKEQSKMFLQQTAEALASAIDANDSYTHGHSARVAKYAQKIAQEAGLSEDECDDIYLAGLLHDVGKVGIDNSIINKTGKLTNEEYAIIKQHPVLGDEILAKIQMSPSLSIGARHHHERYDGKGYPDNLKGEDIPRNARIIAVADAYDAMTSKRSYRDIIPQMQVREELVKGIGTQFDPEYAKIMIHLLDLDEEYQMKENCREDIFEVDSTYEFGVFKTNVSAGLRITDCPVTIQLQYEPSSDGGMPTLLFYDSADAKYYLEKNTLAEEMDFAEFCKVRLDGEVICDNVRKVQKSLSDSGFEQTAIGTKQEVCLQVVRQEDHLQVKITIGKQTCELIVALPDASRYLYLALTGEWCKLDILRIDIAEQPVADHYIPRIAEKATYIDGPEGDIPNVQIDGWRTAASEALEITDGVSISFHTMSLPSARRVWHCPIICLYTADDGKINGQNYKEVALIRLDGEVWCEVDGIMNSPQVSKEESFENWNVWKNKNRAGIDCTLMIHHDADNINVQVEDGGLVTINQTKLEDSVEKVYCYFTGDQCAITDICVRGRIW